MTLDERIAELKSTIFNNRTNFEAHLFVCGESSSDVSDTLENAMELIDELQAENEKLREIIKIQQEKVINKLAEEISRLRSGLLDVCLQYCDCGCARRDIAEEVLKVKNNNQNNNDECNCKFNSKEDDGGESWHYVRKCEFCGYSWHGLHCPHDGYQNPCPECKKTPIIK